MRYIISPAALNPRRGLTNQRERRVGSVPPKDFRIFALEYGGRNEEVRELIAHPLRQRADRMRERAPICVRHCHEAVVSHAFAGMALAILLELHNGQRPARNDDAWKAGDVPEDEGVERISIGSL